VYSSVDAPNHLYTIQKQLILEGVIIKKEKIIILVIFAIIALLYTFHYLFFWNYIVDDAGITFGASKTLVEYGRFSIDKYAETVETYSNPSLMAIYAFIYWLGIDIPIGSKILNWVIGLIVLLFVYKINNLYGEKIPSQTSWMNLLSPLLLSLMTEFILWGVAGLENILYGFATAGLILGALKYEKSKDIVLLTCFSGLISITRPEGVIFAIFIYCGIFLRNYVINKSYKKIAVSFSLFFMFYCLFIAFRYYLFSWVFPNTYYAKINPSYIGSFLEGGYYLFNFVISYLSLFILTLVLLYFYIYFSDKYVEGNCARKIKFIFSTLAFFDLLIILGLNSYYFFKENPFLSFFPSSDSFLLLVGFVEIDSLLLLAFIGIRYLLFDNNLNKLISMLKLTCGYTFKNSVIYFSTVIIFANVVYIFRSGGTWGNARFLTPVLIALPIISTEIFKSVTNLMVNYNHSEISDLSNHNHTRISKIFSVAVLFILILFFLQMAYNSGNVDMISFWDIKATHADFGNEVGSYLITNHYASNPKQISYVVPDLGATSYYAKNYTIIDSARLGSVPIAHNGYEPGFFRHYVFDIENPALIETHHYWSKITNILSYDQFNKNYVLIKGPGIVKYKGINVPVGYYIRKDIFASQNLNSINNFTNRLNLKNFDTGSTIFSPKGEIELNTYWIKNPNINSKIIDNHTIEVYLNGSSGDYLIDSHKLTGGYYIPSRWDTNLVILDKKVIYPENIPDGNYSLVIKVIYPDNIMESNFLENITIGLKNSSVLYEHVNKFKINMAKQNYSVAKKELRIIKGIDIPLYETYYYNYLNSELNFINMLIANNNLKEANQLLKPITGLQTTDTQINTRLRDTESKLANLYETTGNLCEAKGDFSSAIDYFEYSIWYNPDNHKLRAHIEAIR